MSRTFAARLCCYPLLTLAKYESFVSKHTQFYGNTIPYLAECTERLYYFHQIIPTFYVWFEPKIAKNFLPSTPLIWASMFNARILSHCSQLCEEIDELGRNTAADGEETSHTSKGVVAINIEENIPTS